MRLLNLHLLNENGFCCVCDIPKEAAFSDMAINPTATTPTRATSTATWATTAETTPSTPMDDHVPRKRKSTRKVKARAQGSFLVSCAWS